MDVDSLEEHVEPQPTESFEQLAEAPASSSSGPRPGLLLGAEVPVPLLAIEDAKSEDYYRASDQIRGALDTLGEQLQHKMDEQQAEWVYFKEGRPASAQAPELTWMVESSTTM